MPGRWAVESSLFHQFKFYSPNNGVFIPCTPPADFVDEGSKRCTGIAKIINYPTFIIPVIISAIKNLNAFFHAVFICYISQSFGADVEDSYLVWHQIGADKHFIIPSSRSRDYGIFEVIETTISKVSGH